MNAEVLLFNPPAPDGRGYTREGRCTQEAGVWGTQWPPLSLATAATLLKRDGHRVTLRDYPAAGLGRHALEEDLCKRRPGFAIWSTGTPTLGHDLGLARLVRERLPHAITAVLGTHVTVRPEEALEAPGLDAVIRGEPEGIIRELCRAGDIARCPGISWRDGQSGAICHNPDAPPLPPEAIPAPDWTGLDLGRYRLPLKGRRFLIVAPVRGCPWRCSFCTAPLYYGHRLRRRPIAQVVGEMADNVERLHIRECFIWADTFTADRAYVLELCRAILARGLRISWTCNSRVDTIDAEMLSLMKSAGLWMISFGLESADDGILAASGKGITAVQSRAAVETAHKLGIRTAGHFMFGLPGEREETMAGTLAFALSLPLDIAQFYAAAPFPGTALYDEALGRGWLVAPATMDAHSVIPANPGSGSGTGAEIPVDAFSVIPADTRSRSGTGAGIQDGAGCRNNKTGGMSYNAFSQSRAAMELPGLSAKKVDVFRRYAFRRFYGRPVAMARLLSMAGPGALAGLIPSLRRFVQWLG